MQKKKKKKYYNQSGTELLTITNCANSTLFKIRAKKYLFHDNIDVLVNNGWNVFYNFVD